MAAVASLKTRAKDRAERGDIEGVRFHSAWPWPDVTSGGARSRGSLRSDVICFDLFCVAFPAPSCTIRGSLISVNYDSKLSCASAVLSEQISPDEISIHIRIAWQLMHIALVPSRWLLRFYRTSAASSAAYLMLVRDPKDCVELEAPLKG